MRIHLSKHIIIAAAMLISCPAVFNASANPLDATWSAGNTQPSPETSRHSAEKHIKKILFIGDSMTGWMAERLNAYGVKNGFEVATVVWDGSTISKWADSSRVASIIKEQKPDAVFISLGLNELFERNPETRFGTKVSKIVNAMGDTPYLWIGPPSWPGHKEGTVLDEWLEQKLGSKHYFSSFGLTLPRQSKSNPHPSKAGIIKWIDSVADWIPENTDLNFESLDNPGANQMSRGKTFIYKRMKENL